MLKMFQEFSYKFFIGLFSVTTQVEIILIRLFQSKRLIKGIKKNPGTQFGFVMTWRKVLIIMNEKSPEPGNPGLGRQEFYEKGLNRSCSTVEVNFSPAFIKYACS
jgi:hypothetical protein